MPTSLAYHLADIYLEELDKVLGSPPVDSSLPAPLSTLLAPFYTLAARTATTVTYQRIQSTLFEPIISSLSSRQDFDEPSRKRPRLNTPTFPHLVRNACAINPAAEGALSNTAIRKVLLKQLFDVASEPDTRDANRRKMYAFWKENMEDGENEGEPLSRSRPSLGANKSREVDGS